MNQLYVILQEIRPEFDFHTSEDLIADGMLDSLDIVTLVSTLDKRFGISIDGVEIIPENFRNVAAIGALLEKHGVTL
jgi:acyl carrier protein